MRSPGPLINPSAGAIPDASAASLPHGHDRAVGASSADEPLQLTAPHVAEPPWYVRDVAALAEEFKVDLTNGLSSTEVPERTARSGPNRLVESKRRSPLRMLADVMVLVLAAAAVVAGIVGEPQDTIAIVAILILKAALGFVQEYRAERAMAALRAMAAPSARVRRDGTLQTIPAADLVPGDVVLLEPGAIVPRGRAACPRTESSRG